MLFYYLQSFLSLPLFKEERERERENLGTVLFFGRNNCFYTNKLKKFLKKKSKKFYYIESLKIGETIKKKFLYFKYDYIFCFRSFYILKKNLLDKVKEAAINFHPGTPKYRGTGCVNYAVYENAKFYGCTAHLINEKVDNGKIIDVRKFLLDKKLNIKQILEKTYILMLKQAFYIIKSLIKNKKNLNVLIKKNLKYKWSNKIKKLSDLNKFYEINLKCNIKEFKKKIRATNTENFKPFVYLHKRKFVLSE